MSDPTLWRHARQCAFVLPSDPEAFKRAFGKEEFGA